VSNQILERTPPVDRKYQRTATTLLAHSLFDRGRYEEAEAAYLRVQGFLVANDPDRANIEERIAASIYKQAEAKRTAGDSTGAVDAFLRVAALAPNAKARTNAEYDAAAILLEGKQWERAAQILETFRRNNPNSELVPDATRSLAVAYLELGRGPQAAAELERVAASPAEQVEVRRAALWQAAELYEKGASPTNAARLYADYVKQYPSPIDPAMDARQKLADMAKAQNDFKGRSAWLDDIIKADKAAGASRTDRSK
jgi:tetratricopeptide (TPR) repeat protein